MEIDDGEGGTGIVIEVKYSDPAGLEAASRAALKQIREKQYEERLLEAGMQRILNYGIACCQKRCKVAMEEL